MKSELDTISLSIDSRDTVKLKFLIDTGAEISIIRSSSLTPGVEYQMQDGVDIKGITNAVMKTEGTVDLKLFTDTHETVHTFHVLTGDCNMHYDAILGKDFLEERESVINYCSRQIIMNDNVVVKFDPKQTAITTEPCRLTLKARTETIVRVITASKGLGLLAKSELVLGVYLAASLTRAVNGGCVTSIINTRDTDVTIDLPRVDLEGLALNESEGALTLTLTADSGSSARRLSTLRNQLRLEHLNAEERTSIVAICEEYNDVFHLPGDKLTCTSAIEHAIPTPTINPHRAINVRQYPIPEAHKDEVQRQTEQMLADGIIQHSTSGWNSPLLVVPKKTDASGKTKWRVVVDFRKLNEASLGDGFPIPLISEILSSLGNSKYFTTLDCANGFLQIPLRAEDRHKTAFSKKYGHFEYKSMPYGLKGAPATFQRLMSTVFSGMQGLEALVYLDDVITWGETLKAYNDKLREVLARLRMHNLKLQPDKCEFLRKEVTYLGHRLTTEGLLPDPNKIRAVKDFPTPTNTRQLKGFLGLAGYYRKFIPNFGDIAKPLTSLLRKNTPYVWDQKTNEAFIKFKELLIIEPLLQYPDFTKQFVVTTDASNQALGAILSQGPIGEDKPIAYASKTLAGAERNYSTTEKELLAIVFTCKQFRQYVFGRKFIVVTDHKPLTWVFNVKDPSSRLLKWRIKLYEFDFEIIYKEGKRNTNADALSRINLPEVNTVNEISSVPTDEEKMKIMREFHEQPIGGHLGMNRTYERIKQYTSWPGMKEEIENYIKH
jgi:hypothetical protein